MGFPVVTNGDLQNFLSFHGLAACGRLPLREHSSLSNFHIVSTVLVEKMSDVQMRQLWVISFEDGGSMVSIIWIYEVVLLGGVVVHVVQPSLPAGGDFLNLQGEQFACIRVLNPSALVLVLVLAEILVVAVAELIGAHQRGELFAESSLVVGWLLRLSSQDCSHQSLLSIELPEFWAHQSDGHSP